MLRWVIVIAGLALSGAGCLSRALAVDTQAIEVIWTFPSGDFGCNAERPDLPVVRIRAQIQNAGVDDELFDWVPCYREPGFAGDVATFGVTTPLELGSYDVSVELYDRVGGTLLGRSPGAPRTAILTDPLSLYVLDVTIEPVP